MATNYIQVGDTLDITTPAAGLTSGQLYVAGALCGIAGQTTVSGEANTLTIRGVFSLAKAAVTVTQWDRAFWDAANAVVTNVESGNRPIGVFTAAAASGAANGNVLLLPGGDFDRSQVVSLISPTGGVTQGTPVLIGDLLAIPLATALATVAFDAIIGGVHTLAKAAVTVTEGQRAYWDSSASKTTNLAANNKFIGYYTAGVASGTGTAELLLSQSNDYDNGQVVSMIAPGGGVAEGTPVLIAGVLVIPLETAAATVAFRGLVGGVHELTKKTTDVVTQGQVLYWDNTNSQLTNAPDSASVTYRVGVASEAADGVTATVSVLLDSVALRSLYTEEGALDLTAPAGGYTAAQGLLVGEIFGIVGIAAAETEATILYTRGIHTTAKAAVTIVAGDEAFWDNTNAVVTNVEGNNRFIGYFTAAAASGAANGVVLLTPGYNYQNGTQVTLTAPAGGLTKGTPKLIGTLFVVAGETKAETLACKCVVGGVHRIAKKSTDVVTEGLKLYWDTGNSYLTITPNSNYLVATALEPDATGTAVANMIVLLDGTATTQESA